MIWLCANALPASAECCIDPAVSPAPVGSASVVVVAFLLEHGGTVLSQSQHMAVVLASNSISLTLVFLISCVGECFSIAVIYLACVLFFAGGHIRLSVANLLKLCSCTYSTESPRTTNVIVCHSL